MTEHKFRFRKPCTPDEHLEAIYEELSLSPAENKIRQNVTLKDYVVDFLNHFRRIEREGKIEKDSQSYSENWALGMLAVVALAFLTIVASVKPGDWLYDYRFPLRLWGISFAAVFLGVSIERSSFFKTLWAYGFTKLVASVAVSALIVFSTGKASALINSVFGVDASALPFTRAIASGLLVFQYSYPLFIVVALFALLHAVNAIGWIRKWYKNETYEMPPMESLAFLIFSVIVFIFAAHWIKSDFSEKTWPAKIYRLAHTLDFNSNYECRNLPPGLSVVFLGSDQARVLVDSQEAQTGDMESFVDGPASSQIQIPKKFAIFPCELSTASVRLGEGAL